MSSDVASDARGRVALRLFVVAVSLCGLFLSGLSARGASSQSEVGIRTVRVSDRIVAFIGPDPTRAIVVGNVVAVIGDRCVLLLDTTNAPSNARYVLEELRKITDKPVRYIVHSHWHYDHVMGDTVFAKAFSPLDVVVQANTLPLLDEKIPSWPKRARDVYTKISEQYAGYIATGKDEDGSDLKPSTRAWYAQTISDAKHYMPDLDEMGYVRPTMTFTDAMSLDLGNLEVRLLYFGNGNTTGDAAVYVPSERVLATGDLLVHPIPYCFGAHPEAWAAGLGRMAEIDAATIVPGHGPVFHDREYLLAVKRMLEAIVAAAKAAKARGLTVEQAQKEIDLAAFRKQFAGDDPGLNTIFGDYFQKPAIASVYKDLEGK